MRVFKEEQRFTQTWIILLIVVSAFVPLGIILGTYAKDPTSFTISELILIIGLLFFSTGIIFFFKLKTRIDEHGVHYQYFPFHLKLKTIYWREIDNVYVRNYDAMSEYGGWGLKGGFLWKKSKGTAVNVSGDIGIQLELKNSKKLLIGTQKESEAKSILETYNSKITNRI